MNKKQVVVFVHEQESNLVDLRAKFCTEPDQPRSIFVDGGSMNVLVDLENQVAAYVYKKEIRACLKNIERSRGDATRLIERGVYLIKNGWRYFGEKTRVELQETFEVEEAGSEVLAGWR